ncbi:probable glutamate receptor [Onthophagus taurus]|uniref:probable glutamate receptor n=1 Tax=Onthophagus taurus TaxID=166361 RepID=UPI0039BDAB76
MNSILITLSTIIIENYLNKETTNCLYVINDETSMFEYKGELPIVLLNVESFKRYPKIYTKFYCENFILSTKNPKQDFITVESSIKRGHNRFNTRKYLILPTEGFLKNTTEVFNSKEIDYVSDIVAIFPDNNEIEEEITWKLYTHKYVGIINFNEIYILDEWFGKNSSFLYGNDLYPDKLTNQHGRTLRIGTITYKPYAIIDYFDGTELTVALELAKVHNMTFIVKDFDEELWGEARENFTGIGILGNIAKDECDIGFAGMFMWYHDYHYLDVSKAFVRSGVTVLVPGPILEGGWLTPFISFSTSMWIAWVFSLIFSFLSIFLVLFSNNNRFDIRENVIISILQTEAIFLSQNVVSIPNKLTPRFIYALLLTLGLIVATIYSSGLASNMTIPRYTRILKTNKDFADSDFKWGATDIVWVESIADSNSAVHKKLVQNFVITGEANLSKLNKDEFAFAIEHLQEGNFALADYISVEGARQRRILEEDIYAGFIVLYTRKGSVLLPLVDALLLKISQSGLVQYWEYHSVIKHSDKTVQRIVEFSTQPPKAQITPLKFDHVGGAFALWTLGLILAFCCFLYEYYWQQN